MKPNTWWTRFRETGHISTVPDRIFDRGTVFLCLGGGPSGQIREGLSEKGFTTLPVPSADPFAVGHSFFFRQEFEKAFGHWEQAEGDYLTVTRDDGSILYQDPYRRDVTADSAQALRQIVTGLDGAFKEAISAADVVILTLSTTEIWRLKGSLLAAFGDPSEIRAGAARFHASGYEENLINMERVCELLFSLSPNKKIFLTIDPAPLPHTARDLDIAVANTEAKALLRAVAATLAAREPNVGYFPAYEMSACRPEQAFAGDGLEIVPEMARSVAEAFMTAHIRPEVLTPMEPGSPRELLFREAPVVDMLKGILKVEDSGTQSVLDSFINAYHDLTEGRPFSEQGYTAMRQIYVATHGQIDDIVGGKLAELFPIPPASEITSPIFGHYGEADLDAILSTMRDQGYYKFDRLLPEPVLDALRAVVMKAPDAEQDEPNRPRVHLDSRYLYAQQEPWSLVSDPVLLDIIGRYFKCQPIFDFMVATRSKPVAPDYINMSEAAQLYHFDKDRLIFLNTFIYLSDVTVDTGPHVFVAGSHRFKPDALWHDGRFTDEEVKSAYPAEAVSEITGPAGTVILADTRALHKGKPLNSGGRLMLQLTFTGTTAGKHQPLPVSRAEVRFAEDLALSHPRLVIRFE